MVDADDDYDYVDDDTDSILDSDTNGINSYFHHHQGHNYHTHKPYMSENGFNLDMNMLKNKKKSSFYQTGINNNDDESENEDEHNGPTGNSSPTSSLLDTTH